MVRLCLNVNFCILMVFFSEVVVSLLTDWHRKQGDYDSHYMWNVSLPGNWFWSKKSFILKFLFLELFLAIYQQIFDLGSAAEAEECIFDTSISEE